MKGFFFITTFVLASAAWADTAVILCATSDMNAGVSSAQAKLNNSLKTIAVKTISSPVITSDTYFTTVCVSITK